MEERQVIEEKKQKTIGITLGIIIVLIVSIGAAFAYWVTVVVQQEENKVISGCLNFEMIGESDAISLEDQWPIKDALGKKLNGYTFSVKNNCDKDVIYSIGLETFDETGVNEVDSSFIKVLIDTNRPVLYSSLETIDNVAVTGKTPIVNKELATAVVKGNETNTHTLKLWLDESATVDEVDSTISSKINITGGQNIENDKPIRKVLATFDDSKTEGVDNVTGTFYEDGELTFSGEGEMADLTYLNFFTALFDNEEVGYTDDERALILDDDTDVYHHMFSYGLMTERACMNLFNNVSVIDALSGGEEPTDEIQIMMLSILTKTLDYYPGIAELNIEDGITGFEDDAISYLLVDKLNIAGTIETLHGVTGYFETINLGEGIKKFAGELFSSQSIDDSELVIPKSVESISQGAFVDAPFSTIYFNKYSKISTFMCSVSNFPKLTKIYFPESFNNIYFSGDVNKSKIDVYFYGPERVIENFNPTDFKSVTWNYTD